MAHSAESERLDLRPPRTWRRLIPEWLRSLIWVDSAVRYDAFLSYSWKSDSEVAPAVQSVLQRFLCPWYKLRARTVFRDLSCLPAGSSLESELFDRLDRSKHLIVLAAHEAALSRGMEMEAHHWFSRPRDGQVLVIVTDGEAEGWDAIRDHLLPPAIRDNLPTEPLWIPLHQRRKQILASPKSHEVRSQLIEDLRQVLLCMYPGRDWGQLRGEERAQRRRAIGLMSGVAVLLLVLAVAAAGFAVYAQTQRRTAIARELAAYSTASLAQQPDLALLLAMQAVSVSRSLRGKVIPEAEDAIHEAMQAPSVVFELSGHKDRVTTAAWNPQGSALVTASMDGYAKIWDATNGQQQFLLSGHTGAVLSAAWKPDGTQIATASSDGTIRLWDGATAAYLRTLPGAEGEAVNSVSWSSDGTRLVTASSVGTMSFQGRARLKPQSGTVRVWDADTGRLLTTMPNRGETPDSVAWSPVDPNLFATASMDEDVLRVWNLHKREVSDFQGNSGGILSVAWSPNGKQLATGSEGKTAQVWNPETGDIMHTYIGHKAAVNSVAWSWDGRRLATGSDPFLFDRDNTAKIWDSSRDIELLTLPNLVGSVPKAAPLHGQRLSVLGPQGRPSFVAWSPDGKRLATPGDVGSAKVWNVAPEELPTLLGHDARVECVAWSPDGSRLASASWDGMIRVWDAASGQELSALKTDRRRALSVAWSPDGKKLAAGGLEWTAKVWDLVAGAGPLLLSGHKRDTTWVTWSPNGKNLATTSLDQTAKVWDAATGHELFDLTGHSGRVRRVAWSPDGKLLATAGEDHTIRLWNAATGGQVLSWNGHDAAVFDITWSPDGKRLATASEDQTIWVWDAATGLHLLTLFGHGGAVPQVAWSPDGKRLAAASTDGHVRQYAMDIDLLMGLARRRARSLTLEECKKYFHADKCPPPP